VTNIVLYCLYKTELLIKYQILKYLNMIKNLDPHHQGNSYNW